MKKITLSPPLLAPEYIQEQIICIRAHRERIFNVSVQNQNGKFLIHNYGQGGAGWTFLFGCVNEAIAQFEKINTLPKTTAIAIIGAGCYGLLTAIILAQKQYNIRIVAQEIDNLPSSKAAGFFFPRPRKCANQEEIRIYNTLGIKSFSEYMQIIKGKHPFIQEGPKLISAYYGIDIDPGFAPYCTQKLMPEPKPVIIDFGNTKNFHAMEYQSVFIDATKMMHELKRCVIDLGIPIIQSHITDFANLDEPIIFNCSNLGAFQLTNDPRLLPVQGHLITLKNQQPLDYMLHSKVIQKSPRGYDRDELIYYAPKGNGILGITFIRNENRLDANLHEFDRLLERSRNFFGCLNKQETK